MVKLKIDLEQLEKTIRDYEISITEFELMKKKLEAAIAELCKSGWDSDASSQYFATFENTWQNNMEIHIKILGHLNKCLNEAYNDYYSLYTQVADLRNYF